MRQRSGQDSSYKLRRRYISSETVCKQCGSRENLEIHHKDALVIGGTSEDGNIEVLCEECHRKLHKGNRSELVRAGIQKAKSAPCEKYISLYDLYCKTQELLEQGERLCASDMLDIAEQCRFITKRI